MAALSFDIPRSERWLWLSLGGLPFLCALMFWIWNPKPATPLSDEAPYEAVCLRSPCWLKRNSHAPLWPLSEGQRLRVSENERIVLVGPEASVRVEDSRDASQILLKHIGVLRVGRGRDAFLLKSLGQESTSSAHTPLAQKNLSPEGNLVYLGGLAVRVKSPVPGSRILTARFPQTLFVSLESTQAEQRMRLRLLKREGESWKTFPQEIVLQTDQLSQGSVHFSQFEIPSEGEYALGPADQMEPSIRFEVLKQEDRALDTQVKSLLDALNEGRTDSMELRTDP